MMYCKLTTDLTSRLPEISHDHDGKEIVLVPLSNCSRPARLFKADLDAFVRVRFSLNWNLNVGRQVRFRYRSWASLSVARIISGAKAGQRVRHRNSDTLDLRKDNLLLVKGPSFSREEQAYSMALGQSDRWRNLEDEMKNLSPFEQFLAAMKARQQDDPNIPFDEFCRPLPR